MKFSRLVLPGVTMIAATYGLGRFSFGLLLPEINKSLEMSEFVSGLISSLFYLAYCFTIVLSTVITTREGPSRMITLAGLSAFAGLLLMSMTTNAWVLAFCILQKRAFLIRVNTKIDSYLHKVFYTFRKGVVFATSFYEIL